MSSTEKRNLETETISIEEGKTIAIISYITLIGLIAAFILNSDKKNAFASFHIRQSLGIALTGLAIMVLNVVPVIGWLIALLGSLILLVLWVCGLINALGGKQAVVPILGQQYDNWFKNI